MKDLYLAQSKIHNLGVFANRDFKKGEVVTNFKKTQLFKFSDLPKHYKAVEDKYLQIDNDLFLGPSGETDDFFNHSCNPNSGLKIDLTNMKVVLVAIRAVHKGDEITYDYSTTIDEDKSDEEWLMKCNCGSSLCREEINDFKYLPRQIQKKYIKLGIVPDYIFNKLK